MTDQKRLAMHFENIESTNNIRCLLCSHRCVIAPGKTGFCKSRINEDATLYSLNYALASTVNIDPIEKKPLYHFMPSSNILSIGTNYCNFCCKFCQNYEISQSKTQRIKITAEKLLDIIKNEPNCCGIAYTYNEPTIWYEFVYDSAAHIKNNGYKTVLVTNGDISEQAFSQLFPLIDAMNIDIKAFDKNFYSKICSGSLESVLKTVKKAYESGISIEITNLLIPSLNDSEKMINELVNFIVEISPEIPLHFSRYHPAYLMNIPATPVETLEKAYHIATQSLKYVYLGNINDSRTNSTYCPKCHELLIERHYFTSKITGISEGAVCKKCGEKIYGVFSMSNRLTN